MATTIKNKNFKANNKKYNKMHPLEPLTQIEVHEAVEILKKENILKINNRIRIISITLFEDESLKMDVYSWNKDNKTSIARKCEAVIFDNDKNQGASVIMNLTNQSVILITDYPVSAQPTISVDEMFECEQAVINRYYKNSMSLSLSISFHHYLHY